MGSEAGKQDNSIFSIKFCGFVPSKTHIQHPHEIMPDLFSSDGLKSEEKH